MVEAGVKGAETRDDRAAVETVGAEFAVLCLFRHHFAVVGKIEPPELQFPRHGFVVGRRVGRHIAAADREMAVDLFALDQAGHAVERGLHLAVYRYRVVGATALEQTGETVLEGLSEKTGIAGTCTEPGGAGLQHHHVTAGSGERERAGKPREPRTDDGDVGLFRHRARRLGRTRCGRPPIGLHLEVRCQEAVTLRHYTSLRPPVTRPDPPLLGGYSQFRFDLAQAVKNRL